RWSSFAFGFAVEGACADATTFRMARPIPIPTVRKARPTITLLVLMAVLFLWKFVLRARSYSAADRSTRQWRGCPLLDGRFVQGAGPGPVSNTRNPTEEGGRDGPSARPLGSERGR